MAKNHLRVFNYASVLRYGSGEIAVFKTKKNFGVNNLAFVKALWLRLGLAQLKVVYR